MRIAEFLDHRSRWSVLRRLGNSPVAKATIAVPLVGYLLLFNAEIVRLLSLHTDFCQPGNCSPALRLLLLYLGSCLVAVGAALYAMRCPALIKKYDSAAAFFDAEKDYFSQPRNHDYLLKLIKLGTEAEPLAHDAAKFDYKESRHIDPSRLADPMGELYRILNVSHFGSRLVALVAYCIGVILLLLPTAMTFIQVMTAFQWGSSAS